MSEMQKKKWGRGVTDFVLEIKRMKNYPNFDKLVLVTRYGLSGGYLKNTKNDSL